MIRAPAIKVTDPIGGEVDWCLQEGWGRRCLNITRVGHHPSSMRTVATVEVGTYEYGASYDGTRGVTSRPTGGPEELGSDYE